MTGPMFGYRRAAEVADAVLRAGAPGAMYLAGGTDLLQLWKSGVASPQEIVDISRLPLQAVAETRDGLSIGALAKLSDIERHPIIRRQYPLVAQAIEAGASGQVRNMATIGGNLLQRTRCAYFRGGPIYPCNKRAPGSGCAGIGGDDRSLAVLGTSHACIATSPGDWPVALLAFDASIDVAGPAGERTVALADFYLEPGDTPDQEYTLAPDELILRIRVPVTPAGRGSAYLKIRDRESYAFALASAAVGLTFSADGSVGECRIALGGVATRPWRAPAAEQVLAGRPLTAENARAAGEAALAGARPGNHNAFKIELGIRAVADALRIAGQRAPR
jgi:xanthine dehydrogenase YagS FAD-binding subunit